MYEELINKFRITRTLKNELIPTADTKKYLLQDGYITSGEKLQESFFVTKKLIACYISSIIEENAESLTISPENFALYKENFIAQDKEGKTVKAKAEKSLREEISRHFTASDTYKNSIVDHTNLLNNILPDLYQGNSEKDIKANEALNTVQGNITHLSEYFLLLKKSFDSQGKPGRIAYRSVNENLPVILHNSLRTKWILENLEGLSSQLSSLLEQLNLIGELEGSNIIKITLTKSGINSYNELICGKNIGEEHLKGINEYLNEYNKSHKRSIKKLNTLYNPLMVYDAEERNKPSKDEIYQEFSEFFTKNHILEQSKNLLKWLNDLPYLDLSEIAIADKYIKYVSNKLFRDYSLLQDAPYQYSDAGNAKFFKLSDLQLYINKTLKEAEKEPVNIAEKLQEVFTPIIQETVSNSLEFSKKLQNDAALTDEAIAENMLKTVNTISRLSKSKFLRIFVNASENKESEFFSIYEDAALAFNDFSKIYSKVRMLTSASSHYSETIPLYFNNPEFLQGWNDKGGRILKHQDEYFLAVVPPKFNKLISEDSCSNLSDKCQMIQVQTLRSVARQFPRCFIVSGKAEKLYHPSNEIRRIYQEGTYLLNTKNETPKFNIEDMRILIDYYKESLSKMPVWRDKEYSFSNTNTYLNISEFYAEAESQLFQYVLTDISWEWIIEKNKSGEILLFRIFNKDYSKFSSGKHNLHTYYLDYLFSEENLKNGFMSLDGNAKVLYKKPGKGKMYVKSQRYSKEHFELLMPITFNNRIIEHNMLVYNESIISGLRRKETFNIIGIDRGERNLITVVAMDNHGNILEKRIINGTDTLDYNKRLSELVQLNKEAQRNLAKQSSIKALKQGFISYAISEIIKIAEKYDAVIAIEDLSFNGQKSRKQIGKDIYTQFERALVSKLSYCVAEKERSYSAQGSITNAYQLANAEYDKNNPRQNGILFRVDPWHTSSIDPTTGFISLIDMYGFYYWSNDKNRQFIANFDDIVYDKAKKSFRFDVDCSKFKTVIENNQKWSIYSFGCRSEFIYDKTNKNQKKLVIHDLTKEMKAIFKADNIKISSPCLKEEILLKCSKTSLRKFIKLISLMLHMRNLTKDREDYLISPVVNDKESFYQSNLSGTMIDNPDYNGAYHIGIKALIYIQSRGLNTDNSSKKISDILQERRGYIDFVKNRPSDI